MKRPTLAILVCLCPTGGVQALGLGEASVRSSLGQPFHAAVELIDAPAELNADCFRITPADIANPTPVDAGLALVRANGRATLHIRTPNSLNDPVVQFVLGAECDVRMQREYTLLLDPPVIAPPVERLAPQIAGAHTQTEPPVSVRESSPEKVRTGKPATRTKRASVIADATPRLVLSGKRQVSGGPESRFALKFDPTLPDPARITRPAETLTPTELSDENTALTRKLAHLEMQLSALHQRNAALEARKEAATPPATPPAPARWPLALLLVSLLAGIATLVIWLRRRAQTPAATPLTASMPTQPLGTASTPDIAGMDSNDSHVTPPVPARMAERAPAGAEEIGTEVREDILDQAEVFVAHGHGDFAIHLLQEHLRAAPMESPVPWLLLLDLQHRAGDTEGYAATRAECRRYFNINLSGHPISQEGQEAGAGLEDYPHVLNNLIAVWNTAEADAFLNALIYDDRGGTRTGFEPSAYRDILLLRDISMASHNTP